MNRALASLAAIKANWDVYHIDVIENFVPFVVTLISRHDYAKIETNKVCRDFESYFGLKVPYHPMMAILNRARIRGYIEQRYNIYVPCREKVQADDFTDIALEQERKYQSIVLDFIKYVMDEFEQDISEELAETMFISFLKNHDLDILFANQTGGSILPEANSTSVGIYLINSYVVYVHDNKPSVFSFIVEMSIGHIMANILLWHSSIEPLEIELSDCDVYLDTGFIFRLLGLQGRIQHDAYLECANMYSTHGYRLRVFNHTLDEFIGILESCLYWINRGGFDPSKANRALLFFRENGYTESDIETFINSVEAKLYELGVQITDKPDFSLGYDYLINETAMQDKIVQVYKDNDPLFDEVEKEYTLYQDVVSISAIHRLREGKKPRKLADVSQILVTTNSSLAYASRLFETDGDEQFSFSIPAVVTDVFLSTLIWIQSPSSTVLSQKRLIASSYAAIQPSRIMLRKLVETAGILRARGEITDDDVLLLKETRAARNLLQKETLGDPDRFTERTIFDVLDEIRAEIQEKEQEKYTEERNELISTIQEEQNARLLDIQNQITFLESQASELEKTKKHLDQNSKRLVIGGTIVIYLMIVGVLLYINSRIGWDNLEQYTFFIFTLGVPFAGYVFFAIKQKTASLREIYSGVLGWVQERMYKFAAFDLDNYEQVQLQLNQLQEMRPATNDS